MARDRSLEFSTNERDGCAVHYLREDGDLLVDGWYNDGVYIIGGRISLREFLDGLGITLEDVKSVLEDVKAVLED